MGLAKGPKQWRTTWAWRPMVVVTVDEAGFWVNFRWGLNGLQIWVVEVQMGWKGRTWVGWKMTTMVLKHTTKDGDYG